VVELGTPPAGPPCVSPSPSSSLPIKCRHVQVTPSDVRYGSCAAREEAQDAAALLGQARGLATQVDISISAHGIKNLDTFSKSDPMAVLLSQSASGHWLEIGRTEVISNSTGAWRARPHSVNRRETVRASRILSAGCMKMDCHVDSLLGAASLGTFTAVLTKS
jgi:hypothetical protein